uniref:Uncharacterized protein n=1 Tax=Triticum urartu TaxID=4572 RepID=A0A8R7PLR3_TRIUA
MLCFFLGVVAISAPLVFLLLLLLVAPQIGIDEISFFFLHLDQLLCGMLPLLIVLLRLLLLLLCLLLDDGDVFLLLLLLLLLPGNQTDPYFGHHRRRLLLLELDQRDILLLLDDTPLFLAPPLPLTGGSGTRAVNKILLHIHLHLDLVLVVVLGPE